MKGLDMMRSFLADWRDRGAATNTTPMPLKDVWVFVAAVAAAGTTYGDWLKTMLVGQLGLPAVAVPVVVVLGGLLVCSHALTAKQREAVATIVTAEPLTVARYQYSQGVRYFAKVGFVVSTVLLVTQSVSVADELRPLPTVFAGYLIDARSGEGIRDARVRVVASDGSDATRAGQLVTDSQGYYIIEVAGPLLRTARLLVSTQGCPQEVPLSLRRRDEWARSAPPGPIAMVFRHTLQCGERP